MSAMSDYLENKLIDHIFRGVSFTAPTTLHFALYTAAPNDTGGGTEVSGGSYARVAVTANTTNMASTGGATTTTNPSAGTGGQTSNNGAVTFPAPTANWGLVTHFGVLDASSGGNLFVHGSLTASKTINNGDAAPSFAISAFTCTLA